MNWPAITMGFVVVNLVVMLIYTAVCAIGGAFDLVYLFRELRRRDVDEADDGRVSQ